MGHNQGVSHVDASVPRIVYSGGFAGEGDYPDHRHENAWELLYVREGAIVERSGDSQYELTAGSFVVHAPGVLHGDSTEARYFLYHVLVTYDRELDWPKFGREAEGGPVGVLLGMIVDEWYNNYPNRESFLRHAAGMLHILMKRLGGKGSDDVGISVVTQARGILRREFRQKIEFQRIASELGISRTTLYAHFQRVLGRTPQAELERIRLRHAIYLLRHSELPVAEIAIGSGFCSSSHLTRKLRSAYQCTAVEIRKRNVA